MAEREAWGPWVKHDGAEPLGLSDGMRLQIRLAGPGIGPDSSPSGIGLTWPGWFWRWREVRTGLFSTDRRRICDLPEYAPISFYSILRPRGLLMLDRLLLDLPEEIDA